MYAASLAKQMGLHDIQILTGIMMKDQEKEKKDRETLTGKIREQSGQNGTTQVDSSVHEVDTQFMQEKIKQRPINKKRLLRRTAMTIVLAVVFGVVACVVFIVLEPLISSRLNPQENVETAVSFPKDTVKEEISPEEMIQNEEEIADAASSAQREQIRQEVQNEVSQTLQKDMDGTASLKTQYSAMKETAQSAARAMTVVNAISDDTDWAGGQFEDTGSTSGLIVADNGSSLLILCDGSKLADAQKLQVEFYDDTQADAQIRAQDIVTKLCILSVNKDDVSDSTRSEDVTASLGSSISSELVGSPVIAIGSPTGTAGSVSYGMVTNSGLFLDMADSDYRLITTDIYGSTSASGALLNTEGSVIGWITSEYNRKDMPNLISAVGITELKSLIEKLSNGQTQIYLGIHGTDVPQKVNEEQGVPLGAYITDVNMDSPAMNAGLQRGDVITGYNGKEIADYSALVAQIQNTSPDSGITLELMREGSSGYAGAQLVVTPKKGITQ